MKKLLITLIFAIAFAWHIGAQTSEAAKSDSRQVLEVYLDKAMESQQAQDWQSLATQGLQAAMAAWERGAALVQGDLSADRAAQNQALGQEIGKRWQDWLVERFFRKAVNPSAEGFQSAMADQDRLYLYEIDAQGNIMHDSAGDPILKGKEGAEQDIALWSSAVQDRKNSLINGWVNQFSSMVPELLASVPQSLRQEIMTNSDAALSQFKASHERELDQLYKQQLARVSAARNFDQFSQRKKAEDATAQSVVDRLIADVKSGTDVSLASLRDQLGLGNETVQASTAVDSQDWQSSFNNALKIGLERWDQAEQRLLAERTRWEQSTLTLQDEGEKAWATAYEKLQDERRKWQSQLQGIIIQGQAAWDKKEDELSAAMAAAQAELDKQINQRASSKSAELEGMVGMYADTARILGTAQDSGSFWLDRLLDPDETGARPEFNWANLASWGQSRVTGLIQGKQGEINYYSNAIASLSSFLQNPRQIWVKDPTYVPSPNDNNSYRSSDSHLGEMLVYTWANGNESIQSKSIQTLQSKLDNLNSQIVNRRAQMSALVQLQSQMGSALSGKQTLDESICNGLAGFESSDRDKSRWTRDLKECFWWLSQYDATKQQELALKQDLDKSLQRVVSDDPNARVTLQGVLESLSAVDSNYLDEYQVALLQARSQSVYWQRQLEIAKAVHSYATTATSDRPTDAQSRKAYDDSLATYQTSQAAYDAAEKKLEAAGDKVGQSQQAINDAQTELARCQAALAKAESDYSAKLSVFNAGNTNYFKEQISNYQKGLLDYYGLSDNGADSQSALLSRYRAALRNYDLNHGIAIAADSVKKLLNGDPDATDGAARPISELRLAVDGLMPESQWLQNGSAVAIPSTDPRSATAADLLSRWRQAVSDSDPQAATLATLYKSLVARYQDQVRLQLETREASLKLLFAPDTASWLGEYRLGTSTDEAIYAANGALMRSRLEIARQAYAILAGESLGDTASDEAKAYADLLRPSAPDKAASESVFAGLTGLLDQGDNGGWWQNLASHSAGFGQSIAAIGDEATRKTLEALLAGDSGVQVAGNQDALLVLAHAKIAELDRAQSLAGVFSQIGSLLPSYAETQKNQALAAIKNSLSQAGFLKAGTGDGNIEIDAAATESRLRDWANKGLIEKNVGDLISLLRNQASGLDAVGQSAVNDICGRLISMASLHAVASNKESDDLVATQQTLAGIAQQIQGMNDLRNQTNLSLAALVGQWEDYASRADVAATLKSSLRSMVVQGFATRISAALDIKPNPTDTDWANCADQTMAGVPESTQSMRTEIIAEAKRQKALDAYLADSDNQAAPDAQAATLVVWRDLSANTKVPANLLMSMANLDDSQTLWQWVSANNLSDQSAVSQFRQGLQGNLASLSDRFFTAYQNRKAGDTAQSVMAELTLSGGTAILKSIRGNGGAAKMLERLFAYSVAGMVGDVSNAAAKFQFLQDLVGYQVYGDSIIQFGSRGNGVAWAEAFSGYADANDADRQAVLGWYLRQQAIAGNQAAVVQILPSLSAQNLADSKSFREIAIARSHFIIGVDQDLTAWAETQATATGLDPFALIQAVSAGNLDDPWFAIESGSLNPQTPGLSSERQAIRASSGSQAYAIMARNQISADLLKLQDLYVSAATGQEIRSAMQQWKSRIADGDIGYRAFLEGNLVEPPVASDPADSEATKAEKQKAALALTTSQTIDVPQAEVPIDQKDTALFHAGSDWGSATVANQLLEEYTALQRSGAAAALALSATDQESLTKRSALWQDFRQRYGKFATAAGVAWDDQVDGFVIDSVVQTAYQKAQGDLASAENQCKSLQAQIVKLGRSLIGSSESQANQIAELDALRLAVAAKQKDQDAASAKIQTAYQNQGQAMRDYNADYDAAQLAYQESERTRQLFDIQDQIKIYAAGGYLTPDATGPPLASEDTAAYRSPKDNLAWATVQSQRADAVFGTLKDMVDNQAVERSIKPPASTEWESAEAAVLALKKAQGLLLRETKIQSDLTEARYADYQQNSAVIVDANNLSWPQSDATNQAKIDANTANWLNYIRLDDDSQTLQLNLSSDLVLSPSTISQNSLRAEFSAPADHWGALDANRLEGQMQKWLADMDQWAQRDVSGFSSGMYDFGLAADEFLRQIKNKNPQLASLFNSNAFSDVTARLTDSQPLLIDALINDGNVNGKLDGDVYQGPRDAGITLLQNSRTDSLNRILSDPNMKKLFQQALVFRLSGLLQNKDYFELASRSRAYALIANQMDNKVETLRREGLDHLARAWLIWNAAALYDAYMAGDCATKANDMHSIAATAHNFGYGNDQLIATAMAIDPLHRTALSWAEFNKQRTRLSTMQGAAATGGLIDANSLKASLRLAYSLGKDPNYHLPADLLSLIDSGFGALQDNQRSDNATALAALVNNAATKRNQAQTDLATATKAAQTTAQASQDAWQAALVKFQSGDPSVSLANLESLAKKAFVETPYSALSCARDRVEASGRLSAVIEVNNEAYEQERSQVIAVQQQAVSSLEQTRLQHLRQVRMAEWNTRVQELRNKRSAWTDQMNQELAIADGEWKKAFEKFQLAHQAWQNRFTAEYDSNASTWDSAFSGFQQARRDWVNELAANAGTALDPITQDRMDGAAAAAERQAASAVVAAQSTGMGDSDAILAEILNNQTLSAIMASAKASGESISLFSVKLRTGLRQDVGGAAVLANIAAFQNRRDAELSQHGALIVAAQARAVLDRTRKSSQNAVVKANQDFANSMDHTFLTSGYSHNGSVYHREAIKNTSLFTGTDWESQNVGEYQAFAIPDFSTQVNLDDALLTKLSADDVQSQIGVAMKELSDKQKEIFGDPADTKKHFVVIKVNGGDAAEETKLRADLNIDSTLEPDQIIGNSDSSLRGEAQDGDIGQQIWDSVSSLWDNSDKRPTKGKTFIKTLSKGSFGKHLGYAPELKPDADVDNLDQDAGYRNSIQVQGAGEIGRMIGRFTYNAMRMSAGFKKLEVPFYERRMWNDDGQSFKSFTISSTLDLVISAVSLVNPAVGMVLGLAKAALVLAADLHQGKDLGSSLLKAGVSAVGAVASYATSFIPAGKGIVGTVLMGLVRAVAGTTTNSAARAFEIKDGKLGWNSKTFINGVMGKEAMTGYITGAVTSAISGSLGEAGKILDKDLNAGQMANIGSLNNFLGATAGTAVKYGLTGEADFNIFNTGIFGGKLQMGLMEMHFGKNGFSMNVGSGGQDISIGTLAAAMNGVGVLAKVGEINSYKGGTQNASDAQKFQQALRKVYGYGDNAAQAQLDRMLSGKDIFGFTDLGDANGETTIVGGQRHVALNNSLLGMPAEDIAVTLQHEAYRDGYNSTDQARETNAAVISHILMAKRLKESGGTVSSEIEGEIMEYQTGGISALQEWAREKYDSSGDYWKINAKGKLEYDGTGWLKDNNGNYIGKNGKKYTQEEFDKLGANKDALIVGKESIEGGLGEIMFGDKINTEQQKLVRDTLKQSNITAGFAVDKKNNPILTTVDEMFWGNSKKEDKRSILDYNSNNTGGFKTVDLTQRNMGKELNMDLLMNYSQETVSETVLRSYYADQISSFSQGQYVSNVAGRLYEVALEERKRVEFRNLFITSNKYNTYKLDSGGMLQDKLNAEMTEDKAKNTYQEITTPDGSYTQCNVYLMASSESAFGKDFDEKLWEGKTLDRANQMFDWSKSNKNLVELNSSNFSAKQIQELADDGYIIYAVGKQTDTSDENRNLPGHMGWVMPRVGKDKTINIWSYPKINSNGAQAPQRQNADPYSPDVLPYINMAGSYGGNLPFNYAFGRDFMTAWVNKGYTNTDKKINYQMKFYMVRK